MRALIGVILLALGGGGEEQWDSQDYSQLSLQGELANFLILEKTNHKISLDQHTLFGLCLSFDICLFG